MRPALTAALVAAVLGLGVGVAAAAAPRPPSPNLTAYRTNGHKLPDDPVLHPNETVRLVVTGFAGNANVVVQLAGTSNVVHVQAAITGVATFVYVRPPSLPNGDYQLTLYGDNPSGPTPSDGPYPTSSGDVQGEQVHVPNLGYLPFRVRDPGGPGSTGSSGTVLPTNASAGGHGAGGGGLSNTGYNVLASLLIGVTALVAGVVVLRVSVMGRRGRREPDR